MLAERPVSEPRHGSRRHPGCSLPSSLRTSEEPLDTNQQTLPSVQGDQRLVHSSVGSFHQQLGVALVGVDQVGERLLEPRRRVSALQPTGSARVTAAAQSAVAAQEILSIRPEWSLASGPTGKTLFPCQKPTDALCQAINVPFCPVCQTSPLGRAPESQVGVQLSLSVKTFFHIAPGTLHFGRALEDVQVVTFSVPLHISSL